MVSSESSLNGSSEHDFEAGLLAGLEHGRRAHKLREAYMVLLSVLLDACIFLFYLLCVLRSDLRVMQDTQQERWDTQILVDRNQDNMILTGEGNGDEPSGVQSSD